MNEDEMAYEIDLDNIPQEWLDDIQRTAQRLLKISGAAFDDEQQHLSDVSGIASSALGLVINLLDPERYYNLDKDEFHSIYDSIIPPYEG